MKPVKDWDFDELADEVTRRFHDALLRGGSQGMRSEFWPVFSVIEQWQKGRDAKGKKK